MSSKKAGIYLNVFKIIYMHTLYFLLYFQVYIQRIFGKNMKFEVIKLVLRRSLNPEILIEIIA